MSVQQQILLDFEHVKDLDWTALLPEARRARELLESGDGPGNELTGWLDLPTRLTSGELDRIERQALDIRQHDALVVVGIGGSFLGAKALIDALRDPRQDAFPVHFAGWHLDGADHASLLRHLAEQRYAVNVISKSGTTTEPGVAFRLLLDDLETRFDREAVDQLVVATTDSSRGALRALADRRGWASFPVPHDVGGRFSVLTAVGLLPAAAAGLDVRALLDGAREMMDRLRNPANDSPSSNPALAYAAFRQAAYREGRKIETLLLSSPGLVSLGGWWQQLFGESEGKQQRGLFPVPVRLTTDLHSLGQWLQQGERVALETAIDVVEGDDLAVPASEAEHDGLSHLAQRPVHEIGRVALAATPEAHSADGAPCIRIEVPDTSPRTIGALLYFFEYACAISAYTMGVNPFDQPGVEAYKQNMHRLLGKPRS
ncbi:MAG: glucose-6-phosphate isomerase [Deltaproteobacteria bacterium]|nr:glucose-6-phosphate isomerase [Deltaproteobacteria bacterium]